MAPMESATMKSGRRPSSSRTSRTPIWAKARAEPPERTRPKGSSAPASSRARATKRPSPRSIGSATGRKGLSSP